VKSEELVGFVECIECIGFVEFVEFIEFIEFVEFVVIGSEIATARLRLASR
jgi:hypothetical protein